MLSLLEKIIFAVALLATLLAAWFAIRRLVAIIGSGHGKPDWNLVPRRLLRN